MPAKDKTIRSAIIKRDLLGLPGQPIRFVMRRVVPNGDPPISAADAATESKVFRVAFTLSRPGESICPDNRVLSSDLITGNSYLRLRPSGAVTSEQPTIRFSVLTEDGLFEIHESVNSDGFIDKIEILSINAEDFFQAENIARRLIIPSISWHSTHLDIPLNIYQVDVVELKTEDFMIYRTAKSFDAFVIPDGIRIYDIKKESGAYASVYREGLNSNSHIYQFLCFYKIIEGILARRKRLSRRTKSRHQGAVQLPERVPQNIAGLLELLRNTFIVNFSWDAVEAERVLPKKFWGKALTAIVHRDLRPIRNELTHTFLGTGEPLSVDELANAAKVAEYLPMTKCFARWMLKNEFPDQFLWSK